MRDQMFSCHLVDELSGCFVHYCVIVTKGWFLHTQRGMLTRSLKMHLREHFAKTEKRLKLWLSGCSRKAASLNQNMDAAQQVPSTADQFHAMYLSRGMQSTIPIPGHLEGVFACLQIDVRFAAIAQCALSHLLHQTTG